MLNNPLDYAEPTALGIVPSFAYDDMLVTPAVISPTGPTTTPSEAGAPPVAAGGLPGPSGGQSGASAAIAYGDQTATRKGAQNHPVFWAIALMAVGVVLIGHVAHVSVRS